MLAQDVAIDRNRNTLAQEGDPYESARYGSSKWYLLDIIEV